MLRNIHVKNFALIDELEIDLGSGFNVLTGETGAGKSIIIDAVNFALGKRMPKDIVRDDADYALSELIFSIEDDETKKALESLDIIPDGDDLIISKKIVNGRASAKINGETVTSTQLKQIAELLIDIYGQHEQASLLSKAKHIELLDDFISDETGTLKDSLKEKYAEYTEVNKKLSELTSGDKNKDRELALAKYELEEIDNARLEEGEDETLENDYKRMTNSRKIAEAVSSAHSLTGYENEGAGSLIGRALSNIKSASGYDEGVSDLESLLTDIDSLVNDFNRQIADYEETLEFSDEDFQSTESRLNLINALKAKYGNTITEILSYKDKKQDEIEKFEDFDAYIFKLNESVAALKAEVTELCKKISAIRIKAAEKLSKTIEDALKDLNFLDACFKIQVEPDEKYISANGYDDVEMFISTNPGEKMKPVRDVASGGELSRIMLALKSVLAEEDNIDTLIFDEIDTGISGRTAQKISEKIGYISKAHQVICVTHLPQIAAMADSHFEISKSVKDGRTVTEVRALNDDETVNELARMLGGVEITDAVYGNAKEMKELANEIKKK